MSFPYEEIEQKLGYTFHNKNLLKEAFTHASYAHHFHEKSNERLEYLGDAVLQLIVTEWQYRQDSRASEGKLTNIRQKLVCKNALDSAVDGLGVWQYLLAFGSDYNYRGKAKSSLFEAITAGIYLDGGYKKAKEFVLKHGNLRMDMQEGNPINALQEYVQARSATMPHYDYVQSGKDNSPVFHVTVYALGEQAVGEGKTKTEAKATASERLLWELTHNQKNEKKNKTSDKRE